MIEFKTPDMRKCCECDFAKPSDTFHDKEGNVLQMWKCGKHKQMITEFTTVGSTCKGVDYKRRGSE